MTIVDIITQTMTLVTCGMERCPGCPLPSGDGTTCFLFSVPTFSTVFILGPHTGRRHHTPLTTITLHYMAAVEASHLTLEEARCERLGKPVGRHG